MSDEIDTLLHRQPRDHRKVSRLSPLLAVSSGSWIHCGELRDVSDDRTAAPFERPTLRAQSEPTLDRKLQSG